MFPKAERIQASQRILFVLRQGYKMSSGPLTCYYLPSSANLKHTGGETALNVAIIVSTKVAKQAVVRNRLRRQAFAILRTYRDTVKGDMIVRYLPGSALLEFPLIKEHITRCVQSLSRKS